MLNLTHEFLYDNFNKKIKQNFLTNCHTNTMCKIWCILKTKWLIYFSLKASNDFYRKFSPKMKITLLLYVKLVGGLLDSSSCISISQITMWFYLVHNSRPIRHNNRPTMPCRGNEDLSHVYIETGSSVIQYQNLSLSQASCQYNTILS